MQNGTYKIELHAHTAETSPCARVGADEMIQEMRKAGYDAVVITDHFSRYVLDRLTGTPTERVTQYLKGYRTALAAAEHTNLHVLLGLEVNLCNEDGCDYLVFGVTEEILYAHPQMNEYPLQKLRELCDREGMLVLQAHPCRSYCRPGNPDHMHGVEYLNGNPRHDNCHDQMRVWYEERQAEGYSLLKSSGSDYHQKEDINRGGILTNREIKTNEDLLAVFRSGEYTLWNGEREIAL